MTYYQTYLSHHGIKGQKWGVRRFQNKDGTITNAGKKRYDYKTSDRYKNADKEKRKRLKSTYDKMRADGISRKRANRAMYEILEERKATDKATQKAFNRQMGANVTKFAAITAIPLVKLAVPNAYNRGKVYMHNHNALNETYANLTGLNEVKGRPTLGIKQVRRGKKLTEAVFGKS